MITTRSPRSHQRTAAGLLAVVTLMSAVIALGSSDRVSARPDRSSVAVTEPSSNPRAMVRSRRLAANPHVPVEAGQGPRRCVDVLVVGFRGSGDHPRGRTSRGEVSSRRPIPWRADDFTDPRPDLQRRRFAVTTAQDRLGETIAAFYEGLHTAITGSGTGRSVGFWSIGVDDETAFGYGSLYRAPPVDVAHLGQYLSSILLDSLTTTLGPVLADLVQGRPDRAPQCPGTELVLVGFSQGAVIARAAALDLEQRARDAGLVHSGVSDVVLIGDPLFTRGDHRRHGAAFDSDHHTDGLLRLDLAAWCDGSWLARRACARYAGGDSRSRTWFRSVWTGLRGFAQLHPDLLGSTAEDLAIGGTEVHVICDSGDIVCSPIRWTSPFTWDSDIPEVLAGRPEDTIHGTYATEVDWSRVAEKVIASL